MTSESHSPAGTDDRTPAPPPGCPAHGPGPGPGGLHRLYGTEADALGDLYERLREEHGAVAPVLLHNDVPIWMVLGHAENMHLVSTPTHFTRDSRVWNAVKDGTAGPDHPLAPHIAWQPICSHAEGDEHLRLRGAVIGAMSTINHRTIRRHINRATQLLVNRFCEKGRADLVGQFAEHLPMAVLCEILGMPDEYDDRLVQATRDLLRGTETAISSNEHVMNILIRHTARRRAQTTADFTSVLINHPAGLTDDEVSQHLRLVLLAAYEATANLLANVLRVVLIDPRFRARLNGGQMTVPQAVEQSLWDEPPFSAVLGYFAKQDTELGGRQIRQGDGLILGIAPGNIDPRVRPDLSADMMGNRAHLAFGGGPHECPGQDIGRAIADVGVEALLIRLPDVELEGDEEELRWRSSMSSRHLVELPVYFQPQAPQDVEEVPSINPIPRQLPSLRVTTDEPTEAPGPQPLPSPAVPPTPEPVRRLGAWQRFLRWWRGY
ncbi:cytochrome P450 [Streptomyces sp. NBC_01549]|uniref:cytochrome P450 n=1 Tax=Streptomyces sp. NBC_01549 TaxID=2975874 RepID=UPI00224EB17C|nr:cytochrome P450 [Streptomyces sp. NBC_01549]MCX4593186.1 cytochrome P450 [Streptomyces sp. NBC_01549]